MNKSIHKHKINFFLVYLVIFLLFLSFLFINIILFELFPKEHNEKYGRILQTNSTYESTSNLTFINKLNDTFSDKLTETFTDKETETSFNVIKTNTKDKDKDISAIDNFYYYLLGYYIIFVMMCIYLVTIINRSGISNEKKDEIKSDILMFLFFANNGSLIVSIICVSTVFRIMGFAPFGIGLVILIIGIIYYIIKYKGKCIEEFFSHNEVKYLSKLPCTIIELIRKNTFECCRCEYYDIITITKYSDGTKEKSYCCTSICCFFWNVTCFLIKILTTIFMVIVYYLFFVLFLLIRIIVLGIHSKCNKNTASINDINVNKMQYDDNSGNVNDKDILTYNNLNLEKIEYYILYEIFT